MRALQAIDIESVPSKNIARYLELLEDHFDCSAEGVFYYCQKIINEFNLPQQIEIEIKKEWAGKFFNFVPTGNFSTMRNESDNFFEWMIHDQVAFGGSRVLKYQYYILRNSIDIHKIAMTFSSGKEWLVLEDDSNFHLVLQKNYRLNTFKRRIFTLSLLFNK